MASNAPRMLSYASPSAFLKNVLPFDNWHMSTGIGPTVQFLRVNEVQMKGMWLSAWTGDELDMVLVRTSPSNRLSLASPKHTSGIESDWAVPRVTLLADVLHRLILSAEAPPLDCVTGPEPLVTAFASRWKAITGVPANPKPVMETYLTHVPAAHFQSLSHVRSDLPAGHAIRKVGEEEEPEALVELFEQFLTHHEHVPPPGQALSLAKDGIRWKELFVYTVTTEAGTDIAGYARTGRLTLKHAAVRNIFTMPNYRRKGIAEAITRAAVADLLSNPNVAEPTISALTSEKVEVTDVTIFAARDNPSAQGIYGRVGFGFSCAERDEEDGKSWEPFLELEFPHAT